jgi:hypothetical protein
MKKRFLDSILAGVLFFLPAVAFAPEEVEGKSSTPERPPLSTVKLTVRISDASTGLPTNARVRLRGEDGTYYRPGDSLKVGIKELFLHYERSAGKEILFFSPPEFAIDLAPGTYNLLVERGFEYFPWECEIVLEEGQGREVNVELRRWIDMPELGWMSGDYHVHIRRNSKEREKRILELLKAADLKVVYLLMSQRNGKLNNEQLAFGKEGTARDGEYSIHAAEEYINDLYGHMAFLDIPELIEPVGTGDRQGEVNRADYPTNYEMAKRARDRGGMVIACHGGHGEFPVDLALGVIDGVEVLQGNKWFMQYENEALFTPHWYHALNCGFKIPGTAASDYPVLRDKILNHMCNYVYVEGDFTPEAWLEGLKKGRFFVTNGPQVIDFNINGKGMGDTVGVKSAGEKVELSAEIRSLYPLGRVEILRNGVIIKTIHNHARESAISINEEYTVYRSSWYAIRAQGKHPNRLRGLLYLHANPIFVELKGKPVFVGDSAAWWIERIDDLIRKTAENGVFESDRDRQRALSLFRKGKNYYLDLLRTERP